MCVGIVSVVVNGVSVVRCEVWVVRVLVLVGVSVGGCECWWFRLVWVECWWKSCIHSILSTFYLY